MKKILVLFAFISMAFGAFAQGNLQFNKVIFYEIEFTLGNASLNQFMEQTFTVPAGKVWKIEGAYGTYKNITSQPLPSYHTWPQLLINNKLIHSSSSSSSTTTAWYGYFPMWLPAGTYTLKMVSNNGSTATNTAYGALSGIEFNIVP